MTKTKDENKARKNGKLSFIVESSCELPHLPAKVKMNGLYVLMSEIDTVMDRTCLEDLESTMNHLMQMEIDMTLSNALLSTFGQWYLCTPTNTFTLL
jgi:hypothetical protein